ncbi:hypothetical protein GGR51DRAFT_569799 [Nemania sp. FL0031]|nr:hypothetical protein GGR51DRAFT_569799 [Nemania sp. FL0031]
MGPPKSEASEDVSDLLHIQDVPEPTGQTLHTGRVPNNTASNRNEGAHDSQKQFIAEAPQHSPSSPYSPSLVDHVWQNIFGGPSPDPSTARFFSDIPEPVSIDVVPGSSATSPETTDVLSAAPPPTEDNIQHNPLPFPQRATIPMSDCLHTSDWTQFESNAGTDNSSEMSSWVDVSGDESYRSAGEPSGWEDLRLSPWSEGQGLSRTAAETSQAPRKSYGESQSPIMPESSRVLLKQQNQFPIGTSTRLATNIDLRPAPIEQQMIRDTSWYRVASMTIVSSTHNANREGFVCDAGTPCKQCLKVLDSARSFFEPCYRDPLSNVVVARHGNGNFGQRDVKFVDYFWTGDIAQSKSIEIRWNLPGGRVVDLPLLRTTCKTFSPRSNDTHHITWNIGDRIVEVELPPYACDDTAAVLSEVEHFLDQGNTAIINYILQDTKDATTSLTLKEAMRYNSKHKSTVIDLALRIRSASYCSQGWGSITGPENLGINTVDFNEFGECGYAAYDRGKDVPLPLSIDHQFDVALLLVIKKHQDELIKTLSGMINAKGQKPWYEIFLAVFVMLSNLEYVHAGSFTFYQALKQTKFQSSVYSLTQEMIDEFTYSAENILYHFCHILKGKLGFKMARENMSELKNREGLEDESVAYITTVLELLPKTRTIIGDPAPPAPGQLAPPDGRWLTRLFDRIKG